MARDAYKRRTNVARIEKVGLLMMLMLLTFFTGMLFIRIYRTASWERWVVPVAIAFNAILWYMYQREVLDHRSMHKVVVAVSFLFLFFYGIHPDVFYPMHFFLGMFTVACSVLDDYRLVVMGTVLYGLTIGYHVLMTGVVKMEFANGATELYVMMVTMFVAAPIFLRQSISRRKDENMMREHVIDKLSREIDDTTRFISKTMADIADSARSASEEIKTIVGVPPSMKNKIRSVERSVDAALVRANAVALLADAVLGKLRSTPRGVASRELANDIIRACEYERRIGNVEIIYDLSAELPNRIVVDAGLLVMLVRSVVASSILTTARDAIRVEISSRMAGERHNLLITISDSGHGFDEHVIDEAYIEDIPIAGSDSGMIGLILAVKLSRLIDATLSVESVPQRGTTVSICSSLTAEDDHPWLDASTVRAKSCVFFDPVDHTVEAGRFFSAMLSRVSRELGASVFVAPTVDSAIEAIDDGAGVIAASIESVRDHPELRAKIAGRAELVIIDSPISSLTIADICARSKMLRRGGSPIDVLVSFGADTEKGIVYCAGSEAMYLDLVKTFVSKLDDRIAEISSLLDADDTAGYKIKIHAMKSNLRTLGLDALAEIAYELERESKHSDVSSLRQRNDELMRTLKEIERMIEDGQQQA